MQHACTQQKVVDPLSSLFRFNIRKVAGRTGVIPGLTSLKGVQNKSNNSGVGKDKKSSGESDKPTRCLLLLVILFVLCTVASGGFFVWYFVWNTRS